MANKKVVFVAFAIEDERSRICLKANLLTPPAHLNMWICQLRRRMTASGKKKCVRALSVQMCDCIN